MNLRYLYSDIYSWIIPQKSVKFDTFFKLTQVKIKVYE